MAGKAVTTTRASSVTMKEAVQVKTRAQSGRRADE
jgi:hypothetical protein